MTTNAAAALSLRTEAACRAADGRWPQIFISCGMDSSHFSKKGRPCPVCGGRDRFSFTDRRKRGDFICRGCGAGDGFDLIARYWQCGFIEALEAVERFCGIVWTGEKADARVELTEAERKAKEKARERMRLWAQARPLQQGDPVWKYLSGRGLDPAAAGFEVRHLEEMEYRHEDGSVTRHPGMLARVVDRHGVIVNLHRTYLTHEGKKAGVPKPKKLMPGTVKGASVHLGGPVGEVLGLAEGIKGHAGVGDAWLHQSAELHASAGLREAPCDLCRQRREVCRSGGRLHAGAPHWLHDRDRRAGAASLPHGLRLA